MMVDIGYLSGFSPRIIRSSTTMTAKTMRMWIKPPKVYEVTRPSSHNIMSTTAIVYSMK